MVKNYGNKGVVLLLAAIIAVCLHLSLSWNKIDALKLPFGWQYKSQSEQQDLYLRCAVLDIDIQKMDYREGFPFLVKEKNDCGYATGSNVIAKVANPILLAGAYIVLATGIVKIFQRVRV
jgi:hypothetical protein